MGLVTNPFWHAACVRTSEGRTFSPGTVAPTRRTVEFVGELRQPALISLMTLQGKSRALRDHEHPVLVIVAHVVPTMSARPKRCLAQGPGGTAVHPRHGGLPSKYEGMDGESVGGLVGGRTAALGDWSKLKS
jgi:hypothetical protein